MDDIQKSFDDFKKSWGEQQLQLYHQKVQRAAEDISNKRSLLSKDWENFKLQLITIAGGTITIFIALQTGSDIDFLTKFGFALLGISLVLGIISLFFGMTSKQKQIEFSEESNIQRQKMDLEMIENFGKVDLKWEKEFHKYAKDLSDEIKNASKKREDKVNKVLGFLHLDGQKIEDGQLILFLSGIVLIIIGLFL